tara:strand:- start:202 stop:1056 length:855 start_codon:yes stop_codon:yes gene_type:complete
MKKHFLFLFYIVFKVAPILFSQNQKVIKVEETFKDTRVVNGHSIETNQVGQLKFIISHRFGNVSDGIDEFFGLDQSTVRLGLDYGLSNWLTVGIGRSSFEKTLDGFIKAKVIQQKEKNGAPVSLTVLSSIAYRTLDFDDQRDELLSSRLFYTYQAIFARKFSDRFSLQVMPTVVHRNLVSSSEVSNDVFALGSATRYQLSKMVSFQTEYYYVFPDQIESIYSNSFSLGVDIETKNHVFQLHVSNSRGMIEKFFIGETRAKWQDGDFFFGFNITRDFQIKGKKYK